MKKTTSVMRFRVTLQEVEPIVWRLIDVPRTYSFWDLHVAIQDAMGWRDCHLHCFNLKPSRGRKPVEIGIPDPDGEQKHLVGWEIPITRYFEEPGASALYEYDFGDGWEHTVVLEGILLAEPGVRYPRCVAGERKCPPEDVGGVGGYEEFLEAIRSKRHPEHKAMREWYGSTFDPDEFTPADVVFENPRTRWRTAFAGPE